MKNTILLSVIIFFIIPFSAKTQESDISKKNVKQTVDYINKLLKDPGENNLTCSKTGEIEFISKASSLKFNIKNITSIKYNTPLEGWYDALLKCDNKCVSLDYILEDKHRTDNEASFGAKSEKAAREMVSAFIHLKSLFD